MKRKVRPFEVSDLSPLIHLVVLIFALDVSSTCEVGRRWIARSFHLSLFPIPVVGVRQGLVDGGRWRQSRLRSLPAEGLEGMFRASRIEERSACLQSHPSSLRHVPPAARTIPTWSRLPPPTNVPFSQGQVVDGGRKNQQEATTKSRGRDRNVARLEWMRPIQGSFSFLMRRMGSIEFVALDVASL